MEKWCADYEGEVTRMKLKKGLDDPNKSDAQFLYIDWWHNMSWIQDLNSHREEFW